MLFIQLGKYQVKDMNVYIAPFIDEFLVLWNGFTMYDISRPIGQKKSNSMQCLCGQFMMPRG